MENALNKDELKDVFVDVRKAYRLLYGYQRRVMDLTKFIGNHYGFSYIRGWSDFASGKNPKQLNNLDFWAWDLLSMYAFTFQFSTKDFGKFKKVELLVTIVSDTGYFDTKVNKLNVGTFNNSKASKTQIHLQLKTTGTGWNDYIDEIFPADSKKDFFVKMDNPKDFLIGKKYDLSDFMNEESTLEQLKDFDDIKNFKNDKDYEKFNGFAGFCRKNGIVLR